jgi:hypothetical protein
MVCAPVTVSANEQDAIPVVAMTTAVQPAPVAASEKTTLPVGVVRPESLIDPGSAIWTLYVADWLAAGLDGAERVEEPWTRVTLVPVLPTASENAGEVLAWKFPSPL